MLKKIFLSFIALCFILFGSLILMMGYVFNNPEKVFSAFSSVTDKFMEGQAYEENEEFFIQGIETLKITSSRVDLNVKMYEGSALKISLHGKVPRFDSGPYILQNSENNFLHVELHEPVASQWVQFNVNGHEMTKESDSHLQADVYVPKTFKKQILLQTGDGHVNLALPADSMYELDLKSVVGRIENNFEMEKTEVNPDDVGHIEVSTEKGGIQVQAF